MLKYEVWEGLEITAKVGCQNFKKSCQGMRLKQEEEAHIQVLEVQMSEQS